jgi:acyl transferase domain-containing protein/NADPH:quinone reductase-like Zn-dependent oxidoreductase
MKDSDQPAADKQMSPVKRALLAVEQMQARLDAADRQRSEPIAIVGIGCRFPGARGPAAFWDLLAGGRDAVREIPAERWDLDRYFDSDPSAPGKMYTRRAGFIDEVDQFDPQFFGIAPREAVSMDPQQRLLLEVCWEALEHGGQAPDRLHGSATGVYIGIVASDYAAMQTRRNDLERIDAYTQSGLAYSIASGRISYVLGLQGPAMSIDTACSSSLTAVHLACQALRGGECRMALAGGVHLILLPDNSICYSRARMLAADGRCKTFDAAADGFVEGEGCGIVVLKRLSDAIADRDQIVAVIKGSAVNQDGPSGGLTVPNGPSQEAVIRDALARGGVDPARIGYVEAHGTGTSLGDPIEVRALGGVFGGRASQSPVFIGSVKTNIGHLQSAAGVAGLIKLALALRHKSIPPHLHFSTPSPHIAWAQLPVAVPTALTAWPEGSGPRAGGVSAFGFSGTNAHVVLEEAPPVASSDVPLERASHVLTLSARSETALAGVAAAWAAELQRLDAAGVADIAFTANTGRAQMAHRAAITAVTKAQLIDDLGAITRNEGRPSISRGQLTTSDRPKLAFLFTGQGAQAAGMARELYDTQPTFRAALDRCDRFLRTHLDRSLLSVIFAPPGDDAIHQTGYTQPALFALEFALAELWRSWGVVPSAVIGHSLGEYVGACVAGVFTLEEALELVALRARLMQSLPEIGAMAAVLTDEAAVATALAGFGGAISIAAVNGPSQTVISGRREAIDAALAAFAAQQIGAERLTVSHAFHSSLMDPILDEFEAAVRRIGPRPPQLAVASNLTGTIVRNELAESSYWRRHLREAVRFADGMRTLHTAGYRLFLEIGPRPLLSAMARRVLPADAVCLPSLRTDEDWTQLNRTIRELYVRGVSIDWDGYDRDYERHRVALPTYPFERARYWVADAPPDAVSTQRAQDGHPLLGAPLATALNAVIFSRSINTRALPYLSDHRKHGTTLYPATAYLEMGLQAAGHLFGEGAHHFEDLVISDPLALAEGTDVEVQAIATPRDADTAEFQLFSRGGSMDPWRQHATGTLRRAASASPSFDIAGIRGACARPLEPADYYETMRRDGHEFGPAFQVIRSVQCGENCAVGRLELDAHERGAASRYRLHPALLDGATQLIGAAFPPQPAGPAETYLPMTLERVTVYSRGHGSGWGVVQMRVADAATRTLAADIRLLDDDGNVVAVIEGMYLKPVARDAIAPSAVEHDWTHHITWVEQPLSMASAMAKRESCLVIGDHQHVATSLPGDLRSSVTRVIHLRRTGAAEPAGFDRTLVADPSTAESIADAIRSLSGEPVAAVVYLWGMDARSPEQDAQALQPAARGGPGELLHVVQALVASPHTEQSRLFVVTRASQAADSETRRVEAAAVLGLCRTIAAEYPELRCTTIDLQAEPEIGDAAQLVREIASDDREDVVAYRGERRFVARLRQLTHVPTATVDAAVSLEMGTRGMLETLALRTAARRPPSAGEIEVRVDAAGLNFRDVLNALGMYEGPGGPLGSEFVGTVVARGDGVDVAVGQRVMGMSAGAFRSHLTVSSRAVARIPDALTTDQAATLPIVFLTAMYSLERLARLHRGERVLIHAGAGGVGLAAIQVAQRCGAEIFATAGSDEKRAYLQSLGVKHVFSSRTPGFAEAIRGLTSGAGVDVILNSLNGEFIPASVSVLAPNGRFIEIGKAGIWSREQMRTARPDVTYEPLFLGDVAADVVQELYADLAAALERGEFRPLPLRRFDIVEAEQAFRFMAQARHIGKIVLDTVSLTRELPIVENAAYLITGAFGGLGQHLARWFAAQGARHLVLVGRQGARAAGGAALVAELEARGVTVSAVAADISDREQIDRVVASLPGSVPLRGVVHSAAVLDDGVLSQLSVKRFETVFGPKVLGAWHLHEQTRSMRLDFFVLFSSMVTIVGAPGQGNYASANSVLDALAAYRRGLGLPATTINWGPWADAGMSANVSAQDRQRWQHQGISMIGMQQGLRIFDRLLRHAPPQVAVLPVQWRVLLQQMPAAATPPIYADLARQYRATGSGAPAAAVDLIAELTAVPSSRRAPLVTARLTALATTVLGLAGDSVLDPQRPLQEYGLDSLMAVELRNGVGGMLGRTLPATLLFKYPTLQALGAFVLESVPAAVADHAGPATLQVDADAAAIGALSEDEVRRLLAEELVALSPETSGTS